MFNKDYTNIIPPPKFVNSILINLNIYLQIKIFGRAFGMNIKIVFRLKDQVRKIYCKQFVKALAITENVW